jgi:hypothetical protein
MSVVEFFDKDMKTDNRQSSKGNQLKFFRDGYWYKADYTGYEGLAECVISDLLGLSSLKDNEYVRYEPELIGYNNRRFNACKSRDFTDGWQLITLERLFQTYYGYGLSTMIYRCESHIERLKMIVEQTERIIGISEFGIYMNKLLTIDALFLNEDRHTHNIAILTKDMKEYKLAPIFDNGAGLLSDTTLDYPLSETIFKLMPRVKGATFCDNLDEQLDISEELYGCNINFNFSYKDVKSSVEKYNQYSLEIQKRVVDIVMQMRRKYEYLFSGSQ